MGYGTAASGDDWGAWQHGVVADVAVWADVRADRFGVRCGDSIRPRRSAGVRFCRAAAAQRSDHGGRRCGPERRARRLRPPGAAGRVCRPGRLPGHPSGLTVAGGAAHQPGAGLLPPRLLLARHRRLAAGLGAGPFGHRPGRAAAGRSCRGRADPHARPVGPRRSSGGTVRGAWRARRHWPRHRGARRRQGRPLADAQQPRRRLPVRPDGAQEPAAGARRRCQAGGVPGRLPLTAGRRHAGAGGASGRQGRFEIPLGQAPAGRAHPHPIHRALEGHPFRRHRR